MNTSAPVTGAAPFFDFYESNGSWSIRDNRVGEDAVVNNRAQTGLTLDEADDLARVLNRVEALTAAAATARADG
jgi:hypothetical protein